MNSPEHSFPTEYAGCVLIVVDDRHVRQMLSLGLQTAGFRVVAAGTPRQLAPVRPDAVVLNFQRSQTEGLGELHRLRANRDLWDVPVLFLAGYDTEDFRWQAARAGADWFGLRPLRMVELRKRVAQFIRTGRTPLKLIAAREYACVARRLRRTG